MGDGLGAISNPDEVSELRADLERVTRERDAARCLLADHAQHDSSCGHFAEAASLAAELMQLKSTEKHLRATWTDLLGRQMDLQTERDKALLREDELLARAENAEGRVSVLERERAQAIMNPKTPDCRWGEMVGDAIASADKAETETESIRDSLRSAIARAEKAERESDELRERLRIAVAERDVALRDRNDARRDFEAMRDRRDNVTRQRDEEADRAHHANGVVVQQAAALDAERCKVADLTERLDADGVIASECWELLKHDVVDVNRESLSMVVRRVVLTRDEARRENAELREAIEKLRPVRERGIR
jgi:chromosome segregation ATPase